MTKIYDLIVIGGGPVGLYATFLAGLLKLETLCIERDEFLGGQATKLYPFKNIHDYPGHVEIKSTELINNMITQAKQSELTEIKNGVNIIKFNSQDEVITLHDDNGNIYKTNNVLLTVGPGAFEPIKLNHEIIKCSNTNKIHYTHDNNIDLNNKNVFVFGGGDSAVDYAYQIKKKFPSSNVNLIHRNDKLRALILTLEDLKSIGVNVILQTQLVEINDDYCIISNGEQNNKLNYDYTLIQFGLNNLGSTIHQWEGFEKNKNKFIVDHKYMTSIKNIYAAGNCVYNKSKIDLITLGMGEASIVINHIYYEKNKNNL